MRKVSTFQRKVILFGTGFLLLLSVILPCATAWGSLTKTQVSQLYVSIFNRASEGEGNDYWQSQPDMAAAASAMLATQPAQDYFGTSLNSNQAFIEHIYLNTLNKEYWDDPVGIAYWVNKLDSGNSRGDVVAQLVGVIEDYAPGGAYYDPDDAVTVAAYNQFTNRVTVSSYMADTVEEPPNGWETITRLDTAGLNVTDDMDSVDQARQFIDTLADDGGEDGDGESSVITVDEPQEIATQEILPTGDAIVIDQPGNPLHGMEIVVPPGAYTDTRNFKVSSASVLTHSLGELFEPLTPMISVENGGDHSEEIMTVQIPVQIPTGWFATAFFFDKDQEKLEPMQLISMENDTVTVATRHFSDFIVTGIPQSILDSYLAQGIQSDFYPGVDDFSFANRGSAIAQGGHCAGQAIGAMWYFSEKPEGDQPLWGLYDNNFNGNPTPSLWQDDSYTYRFCSVLQKDMDWESFEMDFWEQAQGVVWQLVNNQWELKEVPAIGPEGTRNLFALAILLTGEPQFVAIYSNDGSGHAMIVYSVTQDAMHIADPNYPGDINRTIYYSNGAFDPYPSGSNWDAINAGQGENFENILYLAKSTLMPFENIAQRWQEVKDGTIGNGLFPGYEIRYLDEDTGQYELLGENQVFTDKKVGFAVIKTGSYEGLPFSIYRDETALTFDDDSKTDLVPEDNLLGFYVKKKVGDDRHYVDFQYVNVIYSPEPDDVLSGAIPWDISIWGDSTLAIDGEWRYTGNDASLDVQIPETQHYIFSSKIDDPVTFDVSFDNFEVVPTVWIDEESKNKYEVTHLTWEFEERLYLQDTEVDFETGAAAMGLSIQGTDIGRTYQFTLNDHGAVRITARVKVYGNIYDEDDVLVTESHKFMEKTVGLFTLESAF